MTQTRLIFSDVFYEFSNLLTLFPVVFFHRDLQAFLLQHSLFMHKCFWATLSLPPEVLFLSGNIPTSSDVAMFDLQHHTVCICIFVFWRSASSETFPEESFITQPVCVNKEILVARDWCSNYETLSLATSQVCGQVEASKRNLDTSPQSVLFLKDKVFEPSSCASNHNPCH